MESYREDQTQQKCNVDICYRNNERENTPNNNEYRHDSEANYQLWQRESNENKISIECFCRHLKDFIALAIIAAFIFFSGYICYYLLSTYG